MHFGYARRGDTLAQHLDGEESYRRRSDLSFCRAEQLTIGARGVLASPPRERAPR